MNNSQGPSTSTSGASATRDAPDSSAEGSSLEVPDGHDAAHSDGGSSSGPPLEASDLSDVLGFSGVLPVHPVRAVEHLFNEYALVLRHVSPPLVR